MYIVTHNNIMYFLYFLIFSAPLNVSFEESVYEVVEHDERVEVCVILTQPDDDILDNFINVEVFLDDASIYIPSNVNIASKLNNN